MILCYPLRGYCHSPSSGILPGENMMASFSRDVISVLSKNLGITRLTGPSLKEAIKNRYEPLPDIEKRRINREVAHEFIKAASFSGIRKEHIDTGKSLSLAGTRVLAVNHVGLLDVTIEWKTGPDGTLNPKAFHIDAGGDQINVSKVFSHFKEDIALVALTGRKEDEVTSAWERDFLHESIIPSLIRVPGKDIQVALYNMIDGDVLPAMFGWTDELAKETVEAINREALLALEEMFKGGQDNIWVVLSAGGPVRYNRELSYYSTLVKRVKEKYGDKINLLIDFKFVSGPEEAMSVIGIQRDAPQDIIKPNVEEFIQILTSSGLAKKGSLDKNTITEDTMLTYAMKLRDKFNLLGVLVSMDRSGLMLVMQDRTIREKGIKIVPACHTAAGDSLKAGFLYALSNGKSFEEAIHTGNLFGAATASMEGSQTVTPEALAKTEALAREQNVEPEVTKT